MNQFESNFIQDTVASGALLVAGLAWVIAAAVQGAPRADEASMLAQSRATPMHAKTVAPAAPIAHTVIASIS